MLRGDARGCVLPKVAYLLVFCYLLAGGRGPVVE